MPSKTTFPHSWCINEWPADVYPNKPERGRYVSRAHRDELIREGALVRVGRELVIIGEKYHRWLQKRAAHVPGYECPANKDKAAA